MYIKGCRRKVMRKDRTEGWTSTVKRKEGEERIKRKKSKMGETVKQGKILKVENRN